MKENLFYGEKYLTVYVIWLILKDIPLKKYAEVTSAKF